MLSLKIGSKPGKVTEITMVKSTLQFSSGSHQKFKVSSLQTRARQQSKFSQDFLISLISWRKLAARGDRGDFDYGTTDMNPS